jgi:hypothetical protein
MNIANIITDLKAERDRIEKAIAAITMIGLRGKQRGRPPKSALSSASNRRRRRNRLTPAGRKRLSEMMKARWAARRKKQNVA